LYLLTGAEDSSCEGERSCCCRSNSCGDVSGAGVKSFVVDGVTDGEGIEDIFAETLAAISARNGGSGSCCEEAAASVATDVVTGDATEVKAPSTGRLMAANVGCNEF
jgi:hypothetical protein